jgi:hypothetical protein
MTQAVGVLAVRIWRNERGETRARVSAKLDVADPSAPTVTYLSPDEIDAAVREWVDRYAAATRMALEDR